MKTNNLRRSRKSSKASESVPKQRGTKWFEPAFIAIVTCVTFLPVFLNQFVDWDDYSNLVNNPRYRGLGWSQLRWMFTTFHLGPYQPLSWVTLGLDYLIWGMNPVGYHLTNLILHAANGVFFYFVSRRLLAVAFSMSDEEESWRLNSSAAFAALIFAVHPMRVESVAWATERRDVLSGFFYIGTIYSYLRAALAPEPSGRRHWLGIALAVYALSLLSKATSITLPVVLVLLDIFPLRRLPGRPWVWFNPPFRSVLYEKLPFLALAIVFAAVALLGQRTAGALQQYEVILRVAQTLYGLNFYLWKTLIPIHLSPLYELPVDASQWAWVFVLGVAGVIVVAVALYFLSRSWPALLACWLYYAVVLVPVSGIVPIGPQLVADRYSYLPCLSWALLAGGGFLSMWTISTNKKPSRGKAALGCAMPVVILFILGFLTWKQTGVWRDSRTLWEYVLVIGPNSSIAHDALGKMAEAEGNSGQALTLYRRAVAINPGNAGANFNLARLLARYGQLHDAVSHYRATLRIDPDDAAAHNNLGLLLASQGESTEALEHFYRAVAIDPSYALAFFNLGRVFSSQGQEEKAVQNYRQALKLSADQIEIHLGLGNALEKQGHLEEAKEHFEAAVKLKPDSADAHAALARLLAAMGAKDDAEKHYQEAIRLLKLQTKVAKSR
jgi:tetratricopeptide (TPR) repeat protein